MRTLAIIAIVLWLLGSAVFADWKRGVRYPTRTFAVVCTTALAELTFLALAVWVVVRG